MQKLYLYVFINMSSLFGFMQFNFFRSIFGFTKISFMTYIIK